MRNRLLEGKKVLITAGPTREHLDPVRYISNQTGGSLGYDIASLMLEEGAKVFLVSGPVKVDINHPSLTVVKVNTACEMYMACCRFFEDSDIVVFTAAVSDYRPKEMVYSRIENNEETITIKMIKNMDVAGAFAQVKGKRITVGFITDETNDIQKAMDKMDRKNFDLIILNTISPDSVRNLNNVSIIKSDYTVQPLSPLKSRKEKVKDIMEAIAISWNEKREMGFVQELPAARPDSRGPLQAWA